VFSLTRPTAAEIDQQVATAANLPAAAPPLLSLLNGLDPAERLPFGFAHDCKRSCIGLGGSAFIAAKAAFKQWVIFDLGWVRVANPQASIAADQIVAVEAHTFGLWTLNLSRILEAVDSATRFGFVYATTAMHVEEGEERFLLEFDPASGDVCYEVEAVSRPRATLARIGFPITRAFQHKFSRDSHRRMCSEVSDEPPDARKYHQRNQKDTPFFIGN
jgi:uncharacterized protein (UPF0548 family)